MSPVSHEDDPSIPRLDLFFSILISSYKTVVPNFTNLTSTITLRACFSSYSSDDRPWRT